MFRNITQRLTSGKADHRYFISHVPSQASEAPSCVHYVRSVQLFFSEMWKILNFLSVNMFNILIFST